MKSIHSVFEDSEYKKIIDKKNELGLTWHDFLILLGNTDFKEKKIRK